MVKKLSWLVLTNIGRYLLFFVMLIIGWFLADNISNPNGLAYSILNWIGWIGAAGIAIQTLVFIAFAWIINPIREKKNENRQN